MTIFVQYTEGHLYDGTNAAEIIALLAGDPMGAWSIQSETPTVLNMKYDRPEYAPEYYQVRKNSYVFVAPDGRYNGEQQMEELLPLCKVWQQEGPKLQSGVGIVPVLLANAETDVTVHFPEAFLDDEFTVTAFTMSGTNPVSPLEIQGEIAIVDANTVEITIKNTGVLSLGGFVIAHAVR